MVRPQQFIMLFLIHYQHWTPGNWLTKNYMLPHMILLRGLKTCIDFLHYQGPGTLSVIRAHLVNQTTPSAYY